MFTNFAPGDSLARARSATDDQNNFVMIVTFDARLTILCDNRLVVSGPCAVQVSSLTSP